MTSSYLMDCVNASTLIIALRNLLVTLGIEISSGSTFNITQYCKHADCNYTINKWKGQMAAIHEATIQKFGLKKDFMVDYETQTTTARVDELYFILHRSERVAWLETELLKMLETQKEERTDASAILKQTACHPRVSNVQRILGGISNAKDSPGGTHILSPS
ncbi:hypothetical protein MP228_007362 [Amoeboaphelidium protococcarum]|nr:hypothetical protein MP228_007362 [Amoeboaphelidium protococcarum]